MTTTSDRPTTVHDPAAGTPPPGASVDLSPPGPSPAGPHGDAPADDLPELRLRRARDLLAYLPHRLGFRPQESLVVAAVDGDRRLGLVARVDLADLAGPCGRLLASDLVAHLLEDRAETVIAVVHTTTDPREPDGRGGLRPVRGTPALVAGDRFALAWEERCGAGRIEEWVVTRDGYLHLDCRDPACCPLGGCPMDDGSEDALDRRLTEARPAPAEHRRDLGRIDLAPAGARRSADSARLRWADRLRRARRTCAAAVHPIGRPPVDRAGTGRTGADGPGAGVDAGAAGPAARVEHDCPVRRWRRDSLDLWTSTLAAATVGPDRHGPGSRGTVRVIAPRALGRLESALDDRLVRDAVLVSILVPGSDLPVRMVDVGAHDGSGVGGPVPREPGSDGAAPGETTSGGPTGAPLAGALSTIFDPDRGRRPDPVRTEAAVRVLQQVVAHGRAGHQAPALTLLALIAWWVGDGPRASVLAERASRDDPDHALARLVGRLLELGVPPGWLRARS